VSGKPGAGSGAEESARFPYDINSEVLHRFDARHTVFARGGVNSSVHFSAAKLTGISAPDPLKHRLEHAEAQAARMVQRHLSGAYGAGPLDGAPATPPDKHAFSSPRDAADWIKAVALRFGACGVGVARVNPLWLYSHDSKGQPVELPAGVEWALVMTVAMSRAEIRKSPGYSAEAETCRGYSKMAALSATMAELVRGLGYHATSCGNGTALSIPLAVDAGLGVVGRSGILLTEKQGPLVRICKVFTDLPLEPDTPQGERPDDLCRKCGACARKCPVGAISTAPDPSWETLTVGSSPGVLRWPVDPEKCYAFWLRNGASCSTCMAVCPYGRRNES
jgi:ferredoxin